MVGSPLRPEPRAQRQHRPCPRVESARGTQWERVINQGGAGKGSLQREKNEGHWARAQERPPLYSECREGRRVTVWLWWRGRAGVRSVLCRAGRSGQGHWTGRGWACLRPAGGGWAHRGVWVDPLQATAGPSRCSGNYGSFLRMVIQGPAFRSP